MKNVGIILYIQAKMDEQILHAKAVFLLLPWLVPLYSVLSCVLKINSDISKERGMIMKGHIKKPLSEAIAHSSQLSLPLHQKDTFNIWTFHVTLG